MKKKANKIDRIRQRLADKIRPHIAEEGTNRRLGIELYSTGSKTLRTMQKMAPEVYAYFNCDDQRRECLKNQLAHGLLPAVADHLQISTIYDLDEEVYIVLGDLVIEREVTE